MLANTGPGVEPRLVRTRAQQARILGKSSSQCISTSPQNKPTYRQKTKRKKSDIQESDASSGEREVRALEKLTKKVFPPQARQGIQRDGLQDIQLMAIAALREKLEKDCTDGEDGLMNPMKALDCLNELQRKTCPEAYEPEIVMANRLKEEGIREEQEFWKEMDKTLFDFDDDVDNLSDVSERYKQTQLAKVQLPQKEYIERGESIVKFNDERDQSIEKKDKRSKLRTENQKQRRILILNFQCPDYQFIRHLYLKEGYRGLKELQIKEIAYKVNSKVKKQRLQREPKNFFMIRQRQISQKILKRLSQKMKINKEFRQAHQTLIRANSTIVSQMVLNFIERYHIECSGRHIYSDKVMEEVLTRAGTSRVDTDDFDGNDSKFVNFNFNNLQQKLLYE